MKHVEYLTKLGLFTTTNKVKSNVVRNARRYSIIHEYINYHTQFLPTTVSFSERVYCLKQEIQSAPVCISCNKTLVWQNATLGYLTFCSTKCAQNSQQTRDKLILTNIARYGVEYNITSEQSNIKRKKTNIKRFGKENPFQADIIKEKIKETNLERHGVENPMQSKIIQEKTKITNNERYGVEYTFQSDIIKEKIKNTNNERYGVDNPMQSKIIQDRAKVTNNERYGTDYPSQSYIIKEKTKKTNILHWGVEYPMQSIILQNKVKVTNNERYGMDFPSQSNIIKEKTKETNLKNWGVINPFQSDIIRAKVKETTFKNWGVEYISQSAEIQERITQTSIKKYGTERPQQSDIVKANVIAANMIKYGVSYHTQSHLLHNDILIKLQSYDYLLSEHHIHKKSVVEISYNLNISPITTAAYLRYHNIEIIYYTGSFGQKQMYDFISSIYIGNISTNNRDIKTYEIDIFLPEHNIGFEYNGIYWHSELTNTPKDYHINKTLICNKHNIQLIQIWETEWLNKHDIVKSRISSLLGLNERIFARKCTIQEINNEQATQFFNETHLQGTESADVYIGLIYNNELVACMSFYCMTHYQVELLQYSSKLYINIVGGASKLLNYYIKNYNPNYIISYSDKRWSCGNLYKQLGFVNTVDLPPEPYYFKNNSGLITGIQMYDKLNIINDKLSEWENAQANKYNRIWDCGSSQWELNLL